MSHIIFDTNYTLFLAKKKENGPFVNERAASVLLHRHGMNECVCVLILHKVIIISNRENIDNSSLCETVYVYCLCYTILCIYCSLFFITRSEATCSLTIRVFSFHTQPDTIIHVPYSVLQVYS